MSENKVESRLLYGGSKTFWQTRSCFNITILEHGMHADSACGVIEVIAYDPVKDNEQRIYLDKSTLVDKVENMDLNNESEVNTLAQHIFLDLCTKVVGSNIELSLKTFKAMTGTIVSAGATDSMVISRILTEDIAVANESSSVEASPPNSPVDVKFGRGQENSNSSLDKGKRFKNLHENREKAQRLETTVSIAIDTFMDLLKRRRLYYHAHGGNGGLHKFRSIVQRIIRRNAVRKTKFRLLHSSTVPIEPSNQLQRIPNLNFRGITTHVQQSIAVNRDKPVNMKLFLAKTNPDRIFQPRDRHSFSATETTVVGVETFASVSSDDTVVGFRSIRVVDAPVAANTRAATTLPQLTLSPKLQNEDLNRERMCTNSPTPDDQDSPTAEHIWSDDSVSMNSPLFQALSAIRSPGRENTLNRWR